MTSFRTSLGGLTLSLVLVAFGCSSSSSGGEGGNAGGSNPGGSDPGGSNPGGSGGEGLGGSGPSGVCTSNADCGDGEYCNPIGYGCGDGFQDMCSPLPTECPDLDAPVCGCDGQIYANTCEANAAGIGTTMYNSSCTPPAGTFSCGNSFCAVDAEVCVEDLEIFIDCFALPASCDPTAPTCATCTPDDLPSHCSCDDEFELSFFCGV